ANASIDNSGSIDVTAAADAVANNGDADASANIAVVIEQRAIANGPGDATADVTNSGSIVGSANANAAAAGTAGTFDATAIAVLGGVGTDEAGIYQEANGSTVTLTNDGMIDFDASATATVTGVAFALGLADGIDQVATGTATAGASLVNGAAGAISVDAAAAASGDIAIGLAFSRGVGQTASATGAANVAVTSAGSFGAGAVANAIGETFALGLASAIAVEQFASGATASAAFANSGTFEVNATA